MKLPALLLLCLLILSPGFNTLAQDLPNPLENTPVTVSHDGKMYQYQLTLNGVSESGLPAQGLPLIISTIGDRVISVSVRHDLVKGNSWIQRDLKVVTASENGFMIELSFDRWEGNDRKARSRQIQLNVQRSENQATGNYVYHAHRKKDKRSPVAWLMTEGKITGKVINEDQLRRINPISKDQSWNNYAGTTSRFASTDGGAAIDPVLENARMIWKSPYVGGAEIGSLRGLTIKLWRPAAEGGASPIIGDGKVFQFRVVPNSAGPYDIRVDIWADAVETGTITKPDFDTGYHLKPHVFSAVNNLIQKKPGIVQRFKAKGPLFQISPISQGKTDMALFADEQIICMDASTGRVLWTTTIPMAGLNTPSHKTALTNHTGAYANGRFFAFGSMGVIYALDAKNGKVLWRSQIPGYAAHSKKAAQEAVKYRRVNGLNRSYCGALLAVDDLIIAPSGPAGGSLIAFDAKTGKERWRRAAIGKNVATPVIWRHKGHTYLITNAEGKAICVDAATGEVKWTIQGGYNGYCLALHGDQLLAWTSRQKDIEAKIEEVGGSKSRDKRNAGGYQRFGSFGLYELKPSGATLRWERKDIGAPAYRPVGLFSSDGSKVGVRIGNALYGLDAETGKTLGEKIVWNSGTPDESFQFSVGDVTYWVSDSQHDGFNDHAVMILGDEVTFPKRSFLNGLRQTKTYQVGNISPVVDGRMYVRGYDGVYCYDLRPARE